MYTKTEEAIHFIFQAYDGKKRIKEDIPLVFHSIAVGYMLIDLRCSEEIILTGILHDVIEDSKYTYEYLEQNYGEKIANNVELLTENRTIKHWHDRKNEFLERMKTVDEDILLVELADKLHNLLSDYELYKKIGNKALVTVNASYKEHQWFYLELKKLFKERLKPNTLLTKYE